jgi:CPA2 family monovalent cation:H+ antiporter-2
MPVVYGDAGQHVVLEAAGLATARAILVTVPGFPDVRGIVRAGRQIRPDLPIIARADSTDAVQALYALGIQEVTSPEFEAAIEMTRQALMYFDMPAHQVLSVASAIRRDRYVQASESGLSVMSQIGEIARQLDFTWVGVPHDSPFQGRSLSELRLRATTGVSVVGIIHEGVLAANPDGESRLERGDLVAVLGTRDQIARFEKARRGGDAAV